MKFHLKLKPGQIFSDLWKRFAPSALICLLIFALATTWSAIDTFASREFQKLCDTPFNYALCALVMGLLFATAASCLCDRYGWHKFIAWIAAAVGAGAGILLAWMENPALIPVGLILFCLALCLHSVSRKDNPSVRLSQVCGWFFICYFISGVLLSALMICNAAVFELLLQNVAYDFQSVTQNSTLFLSFILFAPWLFLGGLPKEDTPLDRRGGFRKFTYVVLLPLYLLLLGILLAYVAKIAITFTMPVGIMNTYGIAALTLFAFFHLTLDGTENRLSKWFKNWGGLLLVPVVVVQGIGVWMRVSAYGLTESRVLGIIWTVLCIAVVLTALFRKRANWFFLTSGVIALILCCTPISADNIAIWNQENRLHTALTESNMLNEQGDIIANPEATLENQEIIYSAADYLYRETARKDSLTEQLQTQLDAIRNADGEKENSISLSEAKNLLFGFGKPEKVDTDWYSHTYLFTGTADHDKLDTYGYAHAEWIGFSSYEEDTINAENVVVIEVNELPKETLEELSLPTRYSMTDIDAIITYLEANRNNAAPIAFPSPVKFMINGEELDLTPLLDGVQLVDNVATLPVDTLILPSGNMFHISRVRMVNYSVESYSDYITISGWLLTK